MPQSPQKIDRTRKLFEQNRKGTLWTPRNILLGALAMLYLISPVDLLPDWVFPFIGRLDDLGVLALAVMWMRREPTPQKENPEGDPAPTQHEN